MTRSITAIFAILICALLAAPNLQAQETPLKHRQIKLYFGQGTGNDGDLAGVINLQDYGTGDKDFIAVWGTLSFLENRAPSLSIRLDDSPYPPRITTYLVWWNLPSFGWLYGGNFNFTGTSWGRGGGAFQVSNNIAGAQLHQELLGIADYEVRICRYILNDGDVVNIKSAGAYPCEKPWATSHP